MWCPLVEVAGHETAWWGYLGTSSLVRSEGRRNMNESIGEERAGADGVIKNMNMIIYENTHPWKVSLGDGLATIPQCPGRPSLVKLRV